MSLLEDIFLQDEAGEAQELERIIEGDEYNERPLDSDNDSEKEDEAVEDKRRVDPTEGKTKRVVKNPRFILNPARLTGPRGIQVIPEHFKDFRFKGKGHEKEDLDLVLKKLEHWAYRLYPKFQFEDCLKKIEMLGKKRPVMVHLHKIRSDQFLSEETVVQKDSSDEELETPVVQEEDEFDKLLQQQIELARATPEPGSARKGFETPSVDKRLSKSMPKATSSPSISEEQKQRMIRNRQLAEEKRLARLQENSALPNNRNSQTLADKEITEDIEMVTNNETVGRKHNRSNVIDSSDEESEHATINQFITVDVHDINDVIDMTEQENNKNRDANKEVVDLVGIDTVEKSSNTSLIKGPIIDLVGTNEDKHVHENDVIDITGQENRNISEDAIVDLVGEHIAKTDIRKRNNKRLAIIDNSDEECVLTSVNQRTSVDIDRNIDSDNNDAVSNDLTIENVKIGSKIDKSVSKSKDVSDEEVSTLGNNEDDVNTNDETLNNDNEEPVQLGEIEETETVATVEVDIDGNTNNDNTISGNTDKDNVNNDFTIEKNPQEIVNSPKKTNKIVEAKGDEVEESSKIISEKENINSNTAKDNDVPLESIDDLMDVDFSDDF